MAEFEIVPVDIDLTERNIFGNRHNEFNVELSPLKDIPDALREVEKVDGDLLRTMAGYYRRYTTTQTMTYTNVVPYTNINSTSINTMSLTYRSNYDGFISVMEYDIDGNSTGYVSTAQLNFDVAASSYIDTFKELAEEYVKFGTTSEELVKSVSNILKIFQPSLSAGRLCSNMYFDPLYGGANTWQYSTTSYDSFMETVDLEPPSAKQLADIDIIRCVKDRNTLFIGKSTSYINQLCRWCDILNNVVEPAIPMTVYNNALDKYSEYEFEFEELRSGYNALNNYDRMVVKFGRVHPTGIYKNSGISFFSLHYGEDQYSELPGLCVTNRYIHEAYEDVYRPDTYSDNGLHLLDKGVPDYAVIEYNLSTMEAIEYDDYEDRPRWREQRKPRLIHPIHERKIERED